MLEHKKGARLLALPFIYSLLSLLCRLGHYLRFNGNFAILQHQVCYLARGNNAIQQRISQGIIDAIHRGEKPTSMDAKEETIWQFAKELLQTQRVSEPTFARW